MGVAAAAAAGCTCELRNARPAWLLLQFDETDGAIVCTMLDMARSRAVATKRNTSVTGNLPVSARQVSVSCV